MMMFDGWHHSLPPVLASKGGEGKSPVTSKDHQITCMEVVWAVVNLSLLLGKYLVEAKGKKTH